MAATVAEMTRQKGLASKIQADALEMVHRAEYALGKAACKGQEEGAMGSRQANLIPGIRSGTPLGVLPEHRPERGRCLGWMCPVIR